MIIVEIAGRLGRDPETRVTPSGIKVTNLNIATNVRKAGKEETVWWRVTIWGDRFDKLLPHLKKGSALIVIGEMGKPEIWTDKEGKPQVALEITAEIIRFSPFGGPERSQQETNQPAGAQHFAQEGGPDHYNVNAYGTTQGSNKGYSAIQVEEEPLPF